MKRISYLLSAMIGCLFFVHNAYTANVADTYGLSPKGMGMGNAMTAHVNDWSSVFYNVAGLGRTTHLQKNVPSNEFYAGYLITMPQTALNIPQRYSGTNTYDTNADEDLGFGSFILGTALDLKAIIKMPLMVSSSRFGLALSVGDDLAIAEINDIEPQTHNYLRFGKEARQMMLISGIGMGFHDDAFGVGFGLKSSFGGKGNILLEDIEVGTDPQRPRQQSRMALELELSSWIAGLYIDCGKFSKQLDGLSLGMAYQEESGFKLDPFNTASVVEVGGIPLNLELSIFDYYQPSSFKAGFSYAISDDWMIAFDIEYQTWSDYEVSANQSYNYGGILPNLSDILIPKIGLEHKANPTTDLYFGYYYQPSFVPDDAVDEEVNWLDNDKHVVSFGFSHNAGKRSIFKKPMVLHGGYQFQYLVDREVIKTTPSTLNPSYSYGGTVHTVMLGFSF